jgi:hypothetical protein
MNTKLLSPQEEAFFVYWINHKGHKEGAKCAKQND